MKRSRWVLISIGAAAVAAVLAWFIIGPGLEPTPIGPAANEEAFRALCSKAHGTVGVRSAAMGGNSLVCFSEAKTPDSGRTCTSDAQCKGRCYTSTFDATFAADIEIGGAKGTCSPHWELGTH